MSTTQQGLEQQQQEEQESQSQQIQQTQNQQDQPISQADLQAYVTSLEAKIREQTRAIGELSERVTTVSTPAQTPQEKVRDVESEKLQFFSDPAGMIDERVGSIVARELEKSMKPLLGFVSGFQVQTQYDKIKSQLAQDSRFKAALADPVVVQAVDNVFAGHKGEINETMVMQSILTAVGAKNVGLLGGNGPTPQAQPTLTPPHLRPSNPAAALPAKEGTKRPPLDENARLIMRINNLKSEEEYWQWMEAPAGDISISKIGKQEEKK